MFVFAAICLRPNPTLSRSRIMKNPLFSLVTLCGFLALSVGAAHCESFTFTTVAGSAGVPPPPFTTGDGTNNYSRFTGPAGAVLDSGTNLYVTDGSAICKVALVGTNWVVTTLAGVAWLHGSTDETNNNARFNSPNGIAVDGSGILYVADTVNSTIRKVTPFGTNWVVTTVAG